MHWQDAGLFKPSVIKPLLTAHGGSLAVRNRKVGQGDEAVITLPSGPLAFAGEAPRSG